MVSTENKISLIVFLVFCFVALSVLILLSAPSAAWVLVAFLVLIPVVGMFLVSVTNLPEEEEMT